MIEWFRSRSPREQLVLASGMAVLFLVTLWLLVWEPLNERLGEYQARVAQQQTILLQLQQLAAEADQLGDRPDSGKARGDQSLLSLADRTVRAAGLAGALRRIEPDGERRVRLWLQQAPFDPLVAWLQSLTSDYGIQVFAANIDQGDSTGLVIADITLEDAP